MKKSAKSKVNRNNPKVPLLEFKNLYEGPVVQNSHIINNHPALPTEHVHAVIAIADACADFATVLTRACEALKGPDNKSIGINFEEPSK